MEEGVTFILHLRMFQDPASLYPTKSRPVKAKIFSHLEGCKKGTPLNFGEADRVPSTAIPALKPMEDKRINLYLNHDF